MTRHLLPPTYTRAAADVAEMTRTQLARDGVRVTRGAFVSRSIPLATAHATRAALAVLPEGTVASHATAAVLLGAPLRASWPLELAVRPGGYRARRQRIRVHVHDLTARDEVRCAGLPVTSGPQTWLDLAARLPQSWSPSGTPCTGRGTWMPRRSPSGWTGRTASVAWSGRGSALRC
jgi:hypothetical protein